MPAGCKKNKTCSCAQKQCCYPCPDNKDITAFGRIHVEGDSEEPVASLDNNVSNKNIASVKALSAGRFKITFKADTFSCGPDKRAPVVLVSPCESGVIEQVIGQDNEGQDIILSELFPSEQAVVLCNRVDNESATVITGRVPSDLPIGPPVVTNDVDFEFFAVQNNC